MLWDAKSGGPSIYLRRWFFLQTLPTVEYVLHMSQEHLGAIHTLLTGVSWFFYNMWFELYLETS